jgi:hypothetical protein
MKVRETKEKTMIYGTQKELAKVVKERFGFTEKWFNNFCSTSRKNDYIWNDFMNLDKGYHVIVYLVKNEMWLGIKNI